MNYFHIESTCGALTLMGSGSKCECYITLCFLSVSQVQLHAPESIFGFSQCNLTETLWERNRQRIERGTWPVSRQAWPGHQGDSSD